MTPEIIEKIAKDKFAVLYSDTLAKLPDVVVSKSPAALKTMCEVFYRQGFADGGMFIINEMSTELDRKK